MGTLLKKGVKGEEVKLLQKALNGYNKAYALVEDGDFGMKTEEVVKKYQRARGLKVDGMVLVGGETWKALGIGVPSVKAEGTGTVRLGDEVDISRLKKGVRRVKGIILHCTATVVGKKYTVAQIDSQHRSQGWGGIGYHYVIYADGSVRQGRDVNVNGVHVSGHNTGTIGIVYVGGYDTNGRAVDTRTREQKASMKALVLKLMSLYGLDKSAVHCHNEFSNKACPCFKIEEFRREM